MLLEAMASTIPYSSRKAKPVLVGTTPTMTTVNIHHVLSISVNLVKLPKRPTKEGTEMWQLQKEALCAKTQF